MGECVSLDSLCCEPTAVDSNECLTDDEMSNLLPDVSAVGTVSKLSCAIVKEEQNSGFESEGNENSQDDHKLYIFGSMHESASIYQRECHVCPGWLCGLELV